MHRDVRSESNTRGYDSFAESVRGFHPRILSDATLWIVPKRWSQRDVVVLQFDATLVEVASAVERLSTLRKTIEDLWQGGKAVVPVFSASYRRNHVEIGASLTETNSSTNSSLSPATASQLLRGFRAQIFRFGNGSAGVDEFHRQLHKIYSDLIETLQLDADKFLRDQTTEDLELVRNTAAQCCYAYEDVPSLRDDIVTAGERLVVRILAAYFNRLYNQGQFSLRAEPVTATELGLTTTDEFGDAEILWPSAIANAREAIFGRYLDRHILPIVTGGDGVFDPTDQFRVAPDARPQTQRSAAMFRTSLGSDGGDVTASFLGVALDAEYVGYYRDAPGIPLWDPQTLGRPSQGIPHLDYDMATEAGIFGARATEPARVASMPLHVIDVANPEVRTVISDAVVRPGTYVCERPARAANIQIGGIPRSAKASGGLAGLLDVFAENQVQLEEIHHQRSATACIVRGEETQVRRAIQVFSDQGLRVSSQFSWYLRVVGVFDEVAVNDFNAVLRQHAALTLANHQPGTRVLTATLPRNQGFLESEELQRIRDILIELLPRRRNSTAEGIPQAIVS